jgi:hypothetical protein
VAQTLVIASQIVISNCLAPRVILWKLLRVFQEVQGILKFRVSK